MSSGNRLTANDARALTAESLQLKNGIGKRLLEHVYSRIEIAALSGRDSLLNPLAGFIQPVDGRKPEEWLQRAHKEVLWARLRADGYTVEEVAGVGSMEGRMVTEVRW